MVGRLCGLKCHPDEMVGGLCGLKCHPDEMVGRLCGLKCHPDEMTDLDTLRLIAEDRPKWNALVAEIRKTAEAARSDDPASGQL
ncbi:hypothetical protein PoB_001876800 [Plakobranchus ocellatus]|uniref:Uncharacterized protein n=1 Tax=Plakobranchus ocellatus TaxID=259542 RepID=A0AAV3ZCE9_9GAST|nr:hypothetical protein PoB_001876800 [Plakobranchus ocellatus]